MTRNHLESLAFVAPSALNDVLSRWVTLVHQDHAPSPGVSVVTVSSPPTDRVSKVSELHLLILLAGQYSFQLPDSLWLFQGYYAEVHCRSWGLQGLISMMLKCKLFQNNTWRGRAQSSMV